MTLLITTAASLYKTRVHDVKNGNNGDSGDSGDSAPDAPEKSLDSH